MRCDARFSPCCRCSEKIGCWRKDAIHYTLRSLVYNSRNPSNRLKVQCTWPLRKCWMLLRLLFGAPVAPWRCSVAGTPQDPILLATNFVGYSLPPWRRMDDRGALSWWVLVVGTIKWSNPKKLHTTNYSWKKKDANHVANHNDQTMGNGATIVSDLWRGAWFRSAS
jgi:hypothetical protein